MQPLNLLSLAEAKLTRAAEIEPMIISKIAEMKGICAAFSNDDVSELARHLGLEDDVRDRAESIAWKALLTLRIEVDDTAAALAIVLSGIFKAHEAAHNQRDPSMTAIEKLAQEAQRRMVHYSNIASEAGMSCKRLLESDGIEIDVPPEILQASSAAATGAVAAEA